MEDYFFRLHVNVDGKAIDLYIFFVDVEDGVRMKVLQNLWLVADFQVHCVDQVPIFYGHDLMSYSQKDNVGCIILDAQPFLSMIHDVIYSVRLFCFYLAFKVDL